MLLHGGAGKIETTGNSMTLMSKVATTFSSKPVQMFISSLLVGYFV